MPLAKTEQEYCSRSVKKKVVALVKCGTVWSCEEFVGEISVVAWW